MAEIAVSFAQEKLLPLIKDQVLPLLRDEAKLLWNISKEFEDIQKELESIQAFLKDADTRAANETLKNSVKQFMEASFRIEDVIDEYMVYVKQQSHDPRCAALLCQIIHFIETLMPRHRIASEIQEIKSVIREINQQCKAHHLQNLPSVEQGQSSYRVSPSDQWDDHRLEACDLGEAQIVGIEGPREELISWLVGGPEERSVISVLGMGGIGKTTLVSSVFNNQKVIDSFKWRAWITVSHSYNPLGLMRYLLKKLCEEESTAPPTYISEMDRVSLTSEMKKYLQQKRYVVVFDDVWDTCFWNDIKYAMHDNKKGSRILITTRNKDVTFKCSNRFDAVYDLKPLSSEKSMELFRKTAFSSHYNGSCSENLKKISSDFVDKCEGLPLAIVAIGSLLSKKTPFEWEKIRRSLSSEMDKNPQLIGIKKILGFSYDDLPSHLKLCLLYFGIYPKGYEVRSTRLIRQWIAEEFVKGEEGKTLEDIAQEYLTELIGRSLVQISSFTIDGKAWSCRVHDLVYELILRKFKDFSFCQHISKKDVLMSSGMIRRLSIAVISNDLMGSTESSHTRSLFVFSGKESVLTDNFVKIIPTKYRLSRVLDFEDALLESIPENWGNLAHLKYLSLRKSQNLTSASLLTLIDKFQKLETLDVRKTSVREMPKEICKLTKLRHLLGNDMRLFRLDNGLGGMKSLQTLRRVKLSMDDDGVELIKDVGMLKQLRNLGLTGVKEEQGSALCSSINEKENLEKLHIKSTSQDEVIDLHDISSLPMLQKLSLYGKLNIFPKWVPQLDNLVKLSLKYSKLTDDPLESLQNMPNLLSLEIKCHAYEGTKLHFQYKGFQKLKELQLKSLFHLSSIIIDEGALHSLEKLEFWEIPQLKTIPPGIQHLRRLEVLNISHMSTEFNECIAPDGGPEHPAIQHVPLVTIITSLLEGETKTRVIRRSGLKIPKKASFKGKNLV